MPGDSYFNVRYHPRAADVGLPADREYVFPGLFLAWLVHHDLLSPAFVELIGAEQLRAVKSREVTGPQLLQCIDGILEPTMVTEDGHWFSDSYFSVINGGRYLADFSAEFGIPARARSEDLYVVEDSWLSYDRIAKRVDAAFEAWKRPAR